MKIFLSQHEHKILLSACVHGDEVFGIECVKLIQQDPLLKKRVDCVIANSGAMERGVRYLQADLNRSFPGDRNGKYEERLAYHLSPIVAVADFVIDIHTTYADIECVAILHRLTPEIKRFIRLLPVHKIILLDEADASRSLIGQSTQGVALEFGRRYAEEKQASQIVLLAMKAFLADASSTPKNVHAYALKGKIENTYTLPANARDFQPLPDGRIPFLLHEKAYKDAHALQVLSLGEMEL